MSISTNGVYCGKTGALFNGRISIGALFGYPAAKVNCEQTCASATAHLCSAEEITRSLQVQAIPLPTGAGVPLGFFSTGVPAPSTTSSTSTLQDCLAWTSSAANSAGAYLLASNTGEFWSHSAPCGQNMLPLLCCN